MIIARTQVCPVSELHSNLYEMVSHYLINTSQILYCSERSIGLIPET